MFLKKISGGIIAEMLLTACCCALAAEKPLPEHPRMFLTKQREQEIKTSIQNDAFHAKLVEQLLLKADRMAKEPVTHYVIPDGKRLLSQSRRSLERTSCFAFAYRMSGKDVYAKAAIDEMLAVCRFSDWNPSHYLDTAEMATAVGIGYDWLYDVIPTAQRDEIKDAMLKHAMHTGLDIYEKGGWWTKRDNNWNEVCNAGLLVGALAIADEEPEIARRITDYAIKSLPQGLSVYKPDGAYPEGPGYWAYGASFTGLMLMALEDVFGDDFELLKTEGLSATGDFYMGMVGPRYRCYNFADGGDGSDPSPMMFALSRFYDRPDYAQWLRRFLEGQNRYQSGRLAVFNAIWYNPAGSEDALRNTPQAKVYRGIQDVATMRTSWNDPNAAFVGFKAGDNKANHGHLDIGSFVYEIDGVRWAVDLGTDDYNLPGYFGNKRWEYFRLNTQSHNTLTIGGKNQDPKAVCKITEFKADDPEFVAQAVADLSAAYKDQAKSAVRTVTLFKDGRFVIEDRLSGVSEPVRWAMMSPAKIEVNGKTATLKRGDKSVKAILESEEAEVFQTLSAAPPTAAERRNEGFTILAAFAQPKNGDITIRVTLSR